MAVTQEGLELLPGELPRVVPRFGSGGDQSQEIEVDFGVGMTRLSRTNVALEIADDGILPGLITGARVSEELVVIGEFSSGAEYPIAKLAIASSDEPICEFDCSNGRDDDRDGLADSPADPGCDSGLDVYEKSRSIVCDDGRDNDRDGLRDFPEDPGCESPADMDESPMNIAVKVVDRLRVRRAEGRGIEEIVVVAVLGRGGVPLSFLDRSSLRVQPGGARAFEARGRLSLHYPVRPDVDCDGTEDRLFFLRVKDLQHAERMRRICLSGTFEWVGVPPILSLGNSFPDTVESLDFRACTAEDLSRGRHRLHR